MNTDMTLTALPSQTLPQKLHRTLRLLDRIPHDAIALLSRISIAAVFWQSGQTKVDGWHVTDNAIYLFETDYRLPFVDPWLAAHLSALAEHLFPVLLVIGLASRLSALALLAMTLVIEVFVYPDAWPTHGTWAVCFLVIIAGGPGRVAIDHLIAGRLRGRPTAE